MTSLKLALIGDPVAHSASPGLHRRFLAAAQLPGTYEAIAVAAGGTARKVAELRAAGYTGVNVTTPLKEEAFAVAHVRDAASLASGASNTLLFGEHVEAFNTDGIGALGALRSGGVSDVVAKRILILGAGPTARAAIRALVSGAALVYVWNRTRAKGEVVAAQLGARSYDGGIAYDVIFAALPPSVRFTDTALVASLHAAPLVIDANYGARSTLGAALGRPVRDGSDMLEASARAAFELFRAAHLRQPAS